MAEREGAAAAQLMGLAAAAHGRERDSACLGFSNFYFIFPLFLFLGSPFSSFQPLFSFFNI